MPQRTSYNVRNIDDLREYISNANEGCASNWIDIIGVKLDVEFMDLLNNLCTIERLGIISCDIVVLPEISLFISKLDILDCKNLVTLKHIQDNENIHHLTIADCDNFIDVEHLPVNLVKLQIFRCEGLRIIDSLLYINTLMCLELVSNPNAYFSGRLIDKQDSINKNIVELRYIECKNLLVDILQILQDNVLNIEYRETLITPQISKHENEPLITPQISNMRMSR